MKKPILILAALLALNVASAQTAGSDDSSQPTQGGSTAQTQTSEQQSENRARPAPESPRTLGQKSAASQSDSVRK